MQIKFKNNNDIDAILSIENQIAQKEQQLEKYQNNLYRLYEEKINDLKNIIISNVNFFKKSFNFLRKDWQALKKIVSSSSSFLVIHQRIVEHFKDPKKVQSAIVFAIVTIYSILLETVILLGKQTALGILAVTTIKSAVEAILSKAKADDKVKGIGPEADALKLKLMNDRIKKFKEDHLDKLNELLKNPIIKERKSFNYFNKKIELSTIKFNNKINLIENNQIEGLDSIDTLTLIIETNISDFKRKSKSLKSEIKTRLNFYKTLQELLNTRSNVEKLLRQNARTPMLKIFAEQYNQFKNNYLELNKKYRKITNSEKKIQEVIIDLHDKITDDLSNRKILKKINLIIDLLKSHHLSESIMSLKSIEQDIENRTKLEIRQDLLKIHSTYRVDNQNLLNEYQNFSEEIVHFNEKLDEYSWFSKNPQIIED
ncbi:MAG: hypothetical protein H0V82_03830 [Candidatus Protochlamydia sp.]|nr:hypothetical protein [Candidatus Protochlamydia sp.]